MIYPQKRMPFKGDYNILATDTKNIAGGLGQYTIKLTDVTVDCYYDKQGHLLWRASGDAEIYDNWDFDWKLIAFLGGYVGGKGNGREYTGQIRTMLGSMLPGGNFKVTSEKIKFKQDETWGG